MLISAFNVNKTTHSNLNIPQNISFAIADVKLLKEIITNVTLEMENSCFWIIINIPCISKSYYDHFRFVVHSDEITDKVLLNSTVKCTIPDGNRLLIVEKYK